MMSLATPAGTFLESALLYCQCRQPLPPITLPCPSLPCSDLLNRASLSFTSCFFCASQAISPLSFSCMWARRFTVMQRH